MKSKGVAYALWFFLGGWGAHRFYLGRKVSGALQALVMALAVAGIATAVYSVVSAAGAMPSYGVLKALLGAGAMGLVGVAAAAVFAIWWLVDAFLVGRLLRSANRAQRAAA